MSGIGETRGVGSKTGSEAPVVAKGKPEVKAESPVAQSSMEPSDKVKMSLMYQLLGPEGYERFLAFTNAGKDAGDFLKTDKVPVAKSFDEASVQFTDTVLFLLMKDFEKIPDKTTYAEGKKITLMGPQQKEMLSRNRSLIVDEYKKVQEEIKNHPNLPSREHKAVYKTLRLAQGMIDHNNNLLKQVENGEKKYDEVKGELINEVFIIQAEKTINAYYADLEKAEKK